MIQSIGQYEIDTFQDPNFKQNPSDSLNKYDYEYLDKTEHSYVSILGIRIYENDKCLNSAVIGSDSGATGIGENSIVYELERILICCSDKIFCLSIPDLKLLWSTKVDSTCFEIFKCDDFYIVHGELEISKLDRKGQIIWHRGVGEIFVTPNGENRLKITENHIIATDWNNRIYKFDFEGNDFNDGNFNETITIDVSNGDVMIDNILFTERISPKELESKYFSQTKSGLKIDKYVFNITSNYKYGRLKSIDISLEYGWIKNNYISNSIGYKTGLSGYVDFLKEHTNKLLDLLLNTNKRKFHWGKTQIIVDPRDPTIFAEVKYLN